MENHKTSPKFSAEVRDGRRTPASVLVVPEARFQREALEQALRDRKPVSGDLVHHSDRGVQYISIKCTDRLAEAGLVPTVGSVGDSYDNALAETINGLYKAEVIHPARTVAIARGCRVRHARMGRLVQQPQASRADRPCVAG